MKYVNFILILVLYLMFFFLPVRVDTVNSTIVKYKQKDFILYGMQGHQYIDHKYPTYLPVYMHTKDFEEGRDIERVGTVRYMEAWDEIKRLKIQYKIAKQDSKRLTEVLNETKEQLSQDTST